MNAKRKLHKLCQFNLTGQKNHELTNEGQMLMQNLKSGIKQSKRRALNKSNNFIPINHDHNITESILCFY